MSLAQFLPSITGLEYRNSEINFGLVQICAQSTQKLSVCPFCGVASTKVHSSYTRQPQDLSFVGKTYRLLLHVRRFFCKENKCPQKIFVERLGPCLPVYSRKTGRMLDLLEILGFSLGGAPGAWAAKQIGMKVSGDTILRILMRKPEPGFATPRVLGVDDWSFRKGMKFGTILVDLEKRRPIDLLPDREAKTLSKWLKDHPGVEIISRDRASAYSVAAKEGAPDAIEIADRWHLLKNKGEATQRLLAGKGPLLREVTRKVHGLSNEEEVETNTSEEVTEEQNLLPIGESIRYTNIL